MFRVKIRKKFVETFKVKSMFFIHAKETKRYDESSGDKIYWESENDNIDFKSAYVFNESIATVLMLADVEIKDDEYWREYTCHEMNPNIVEDWIRVLKSVTGNNGYKFKYLLWCLNNHYWENEILISAINQLNENWKHICLNIINKIGKCLSINKQEQIREILLEFSLEYKIYSEVSIDEDKNLFENIDYIIREGCISSEITKSQYILNQLHNWLSGDPCLVDNKVLNDYYPLLKSELKLCVICRYLFDVKLQNTIFDIDLFKMFLNYRKNFYAQCRDCIESPDTSVDITNELLCDSLITLKESNGSSLLKIDGVLDIAIQKCDEENPNVKFNLEEILPICNGGAVYNKNFVGFIDFAIVFELDKNVLNKNDVIQQRLKTFFDNKFSRKKYCVCEGESVELENWGKCEKYDCINLKSCDNVWIIPEKDLIWINEYLIEPIEEIENAKLKLIDVSCEKIRQKIYEIYGIHTIPLELGEEACLVKSKHLNSLDEVVKEFLKPVKIRIYPKEYTLGILRESQEYGYRIENFNLSGLNIQESLREYLGEDATRWGYYEIPFNEQRLYELKQLFYFKKSDSLNAIENCFLKQENLNSKKCCTPDISWEKHCATGLNYYWCMGKKCFRSNLEHYADEDSYWSKYTILEMSRILGYEQIRIAENGLYELSSTIKDYAAIIFRAYRKFNQLKCRACGHLLFPIRLESFNRYCYFRCINNKCNEYNVSVYLNYCYKCKRGLIDSRETKQCTNGKYICRECLACCDDGMFERIARRYVQQRREIPYNLRMSLGNGHNNRDIFFCPDCGSQLCKTDSKKMYCSKCEKNG
ncbi:MAG: hypothetical protein IJ328_05850 [Muribaculaceae bacterium]|nr:hypothetical protein [Muribaculaceae bacterium]